MIFLSAQPDDVYFLWQLQLQLFNFHALGVQKENIHVLIGYKPNLGLHPYFKRFIEENQEACFFIYEDTRQNKNYLSSIRPHIIAKHFEECPSMEKETIFYHDSDIIFRELPDWGNLLLDDIWYVSDTRSYLDTQFVKGCIGEQGFRRMCDIIGIPPERVLDNDQNAGGAQYILKKCSLAFWQKAEADCEKLYLYLLEQENEKELRDPSSPKDVTLCWCADMWVIWWNALYFGQRYKTSPLLDFCWTKDPLSQWEQTNILHYAGKVNMSESSTYFRKRNYRYYAPFCEDFSSIRQDSCSAPLVRLIDQYKKKLEQERIDLTDTTFLFLINKGSIQRHLVIAVHYISKYFNTHTAYMKTNEPDIALLQQIETPFICICNSDVLIPYQQIVASVSRLREDENTTILPYDGMLRTVDILSQYVFDKLLDTDMFEANSQKALTTQSLENREESVFVKKEILKRLIARSTFDTTLYPVGYCIQVLKRIGYMPKSINGVIYNFNTQKLK